jgi:hypothetical protein
MNADKFEGLGVGSEPDLISALIGVHRRLLVGVVPK